LRRIGGSLEKGHKTMMNVVIKIQGYNAVVKYDPEIDRFRGEFVGLNGGADFYASNIIGLHEEGEKSLKVFLDLCREQGIKPLKEYSVNSTRESMGRVPPELQAEVAAKAAAEGKSLNRCIADMLKELVL